MVQKADKDAEDGLQILFILTAIWTVGFFWWTYDEALNGDGVSQASMACCNVIDLMLTFVFLGTWLYTRRENKVKRHLDKHMKDHDFIGAGELVKLFQIEDVRAASIIKAWAKENDVKGEYDSVTCIFKRSTPPIDQSQSIDIEFQEIPDEPDSMELPFCPHCGKRATNVDAGIYCENCQEFI